MRVLLMGPPGAGKGTQAARLASALQVPAISTGDIFRSNVAAATPLGRQVQRYLDAGEYVPDDVTNAMVADRLDQSDCADGFLLDGYPRTLAQVRELDTMLALSESHLSAVLLLTAPADELIDRLLRRALAAGRSDDTEAVVRHRLEVYAAQTAPLEAAYDARGILVRVDALGSVDEVAGRISSLLLAERSGPGEAHLVPGQRGMTGAPHLVADEGALPELAER